MSSPDGPQPPDDDDPPRKPDPSRVVDFAVQLGKNAMRGRQTGGRGGFGVLLSALREAKMVPTTEAQRADRAAQARQEEARRVQQVTSLRGEFFKKFRGFPEFTFGENADKHFRDGTDPDEPTMAFFETEWFDRASIVDFILRQDNAQIMVTDHGASLGFTVYFLEGRQPRRSVFGYMRRGQTGERAEIRIVHVGPAQ